MIADLGLLDHLLPFVDTLGEASSIQRVAVALAGANLTMVVHTYMALVVSCAAASSLYVSLCVRMCMCMCTWLQVAAEEELGSVKEAMAVMSKQHYMDVKRYKDAATAAGSAQQQHQHALQQLQQQQAQQQLQQLGSPKGLQHMIDTHPRHPPRVSQDSAGSFDRADKARRIDTTHDGSAELPEEAGSPVPAYKLQIQIHQLERQLAEQAAKTQEEVAKREAMVRAVLQIMLSNHGGAVHRWLQQVLLFAVALLLAALLQLVAVYVSIRHTSGRYLCAPLYHGAGWSVTAWGDRTCLNSES
jgi:hypothetical protein